ncbi:MAG: hypothetical protein JM58_05625 [Peptococcaceae bacterium BICA1-8]|nr:MAG: hypothetical protein JM58_05625 [Peptococcaceae bacterium BICA1-8]
MGNLNTDDILLKKRQKLQQLVEDKGNFLDFEVQQLSREIDQLILKIMKNNKEAKNIYKGY